MKKALFILLGLALGVLGLAGWLVYWLVRART